MQNAKRLCRTRELLWWHYPGVECPRVPIIMWPSPCHGPWVWDRASLVPGSGQCHLSRGWYRGLVVALSGSGSEYRSLNGVDGLRPCLAPTLPTSEAARGQGRAGPASEYSESVVVVCCVLPQLRLRLRCWTRLRALAPAWPSVMLAVRLRGLNHSDLSHSRAGAGATLTSSQLWPVDIVTPAWDIRGISPPPWVTGDNAMWD